METSELAMPPLLTSKEAAFLLKISVITLRKMIQRGNGPPLYQIGKNYRFKPDELTEWVQSRRR